MELRDILEQQSLQDRMVDKALSLLGENINLFGKPGTGKTTRAKMLHAAQMTGGVYCTTCTEGQSAAEWRGFFIPKPNANGSTGMDFMYGMAVKAMGTIVDESGVTVFDKPASRFLINEGDKAADEVMSLMHVIADDRATAELHLPNGHTVFAQPDMQVVMTMNSHPSVLTEAVRDRFVHLRVDLPSEEAIEALPGDLQEVALKTAMLDGDSYIPYRDWSRFARLRDKHNVAPLDAAIITWDGLRGPGVGEEIINSYNLLAAVL